MVIVLSWAAAQTAILQMAGRLGLEQVSKGRVAMAMFGKVFARGMLFAILAVAGAEAGSVTSQPMQLSPSGSGKAILPEPTRFPLGMPVKMKLLTASQGWVLTANNSHLLWTTTGGTEWRDISPPVSEQAPAWAHNEILSAFFLDSKTGWALLVPWHVGSDQSGDDRPEFALASTKDGGATWSMAPVDTSEIDSHTTLADGGRIAFADSLHGWINLDVVSNVAFPSGVLLKTSDGGRTWQAADWRTYPGVAGSMVLVTPDTGWLAGGGG